jgi:MOSC domain-containing protein YiiM
VSPTVVAVSASPSHSFSKEARQSITLLAGLGVQDDAHCGVTVKHRSRVARDPSQPNLRQVHLLHEELLSELCVKGFAVKPSDLGENITTCGIDLLRLPKGTRLRIGSTAVVEVTGLRNPCLQIDRFRKGMKAAVLARAADGSLIRKSGVMGVVVVGGQVRALDEVFVELPAPPHYSLEPV